MPNVLGTVIVYATLTVPQVILFESFLSFLGLGDRLAVHDGTLSVESPAEGGTRVVVEISSLTEELDSIIQGMASGP